MLKPRPGSDGDLVHTRKVYLVSHDPLAAFLTAKAAWQALCMRDVYLISHDPLAVTARVTWHALCIRDVYLISHDPLAASVTAKAA